MNIIKHELRANLISLLIWSGLTAIFIFLSVEEFSVYYNNPEMVAIIDAMPQALLDAFSLSGANLTTVNGYLSFLIIYFYILLGLHAVLLGNSILTKEERDKTVEFLLTRPLSRKRMLTTKLLSAVILCMGLLVVTQLSNVISMHRFEPDITFYEYIGLTSIAMFLVQMIFLSIGFFMGSFFKRYKNSGAYAVYILFGMYFLSFIVGLSEKVDFLNYVSPFLYFEPQALLRDGNFEPIYLILSGGIILMSLYCAYIFYPKRDLFI